MKRSLYFSAMFALSGGLALAQAKGQGQDQPARQTQIQKDSQPSDQTQGKRESSPPAQTGATKEMQKEETWKGTLVDLNCAGGAAAPRDALGERPTSADQTAAGAEKQGATPKPTTQQSGEATHRTGKAGQEASAGMPSQGNCPATSATTRFGLQLDSGKLLRFDEVGNLRAVEGMKTNKRWMQASNKKAKIQARVNGVTAGDKVIVGSVQ